MNQKRKTLTNENEMISPYCMGYCLNCDNKNHDGVFNKKVHKENNQDVVYIYPLCDDCYYMKLQCDYCKEYFYFEKIQPKEHNKFKKYANFNEQKIIDGITYKLVNFINNGFKSIKFTCKHCNEKINKLNKFNLFGRISKKGQRSRPQMNNIENIWDYYPDASEHVKFSIQMSGFSHNGETEYLKMIRVIIRFHRLYGETLVWETPSRFSRMEWTHSRSELIDIINEFNVRIIFYSVVVEKNKTKTIVLNSANDVDVYSNILRPAFNKAYESSKNKGEEFAEFKFCRSFHDNATISQPKVNHPNKRVKLNNNGEDCKAFREDFINREPDERCNICNKHIADHKSKNTGIFSSFTNMFK